MYPTALTRLVYEQALRLHLGLTALSCVLVALALGRPLFDTLPAIIIHLFAQFVIVTFVFSLAQSERQPLRMPRGNKQRAVGRRPKHNIGLSFLAMMASLR